MTNPTARRSRFVTALGWFAALAGGISLPLRTLGLVVVVSNLEGVRERVQAATPAGAHPVEVFVSQNLSLVATGYVLVSALALFVGVGLIRRRPWALSGGAILVAACALYAASSIVVTTSGTALARSGLGVEEARFMSRILVSLYLASFLWMGFLVWFFRRPSVRAEFTSEGVGA